MKHSDSDLYLKCIVSSKSLKVIIVRAYNINIKVLIILFEYALLAAAEP